MRRNNDLKNSASAFAIEAGKVAKFAGFVIVGAGLGCALLTAFSFSAAPIAVMAFKAGVTSVLFGQVAQTAGVYAQQKKPSLVRAVKHSLNFM